MSNIVKIVVWSLVVGLILSIWFDTPVDLVRWVANNLGETMRSVASFVRWAVMPLLLGAVVVVPIALIVWLGDRKRRPPAP